MWLIAEFLLGNYLNLEILSKKYMIMVNVTVHILQKSNLGRTPPDFQFFLLLSKRNCVMRNCTFIRCPLHKAKSIIKTFDHIQYVISQFIIVQMSKN